MTHAELPRTKRGQISWVELLSSVKPGEAVRIECEHERQAHLTRNNLSKVMRYLGLDYTSEIDGAVIIATLMVENRPKLKDPSPELITAINASEAKMENLPARIHEATQNANYWKRQITLREDDRAIREAMGLHAAWKMTATRLQAELDAKPSTAA